MRSSIAFVRAMSQRHHNYQQSARLFHLIGGTTVRVRVRASSVKFAIWDAVPRPCKAMGWARPLHHPLSSPQPPHLATHLTGSPHHRN